MYSVRGFNVVAHVQYWVVIVHEMVLLCKPNNITTQHLHICQDRNMEGSIVT